MPSVMLAFSKLHASCRRMFSRTKGWEIMEELDLKCSDDFKVIQWIFKLCVSAALLLSS